MTRRLPVALLLLSASVLVQRAARADRQDGAVELGLRFGVGLPFGGVDGSAGDGLDQTIAFSTPLVLDLGYRVDPTLLVGLYGSYAFASSASALRNECSSRDESCSSRDLRAGIQAQIHGSPARVWDPWIGVGSGYEWTQVDAGSQPLGISGWEILHVDAGLDVRASSAAGLGPFVSWSIGQYEFETTAGNTTAVTAHAFHEWLVLGFHGVIDFRVTRTSNAQETGSREP
jgi:hypothetical protein